MQRAKVLMTVSEQEQARTIHTVYQSPREVDNRKMQITELTEQVAALTVQQKSAGPRVVRIVVLCVTLVVRNVSFVVCTVVLL